MAQLYHWHNFYSYYHKMRRIKQSHRATVLEHVTYKHMPLTSAYHQPKSSLILRRNKLYDRVAQIIIDYDECSTYWQ